MGIDELRNPRLFIRCLHSSTGHAMADISESQSGRHCSLVERGKKSNAVANGLGCDFDVPPPASTESELHSIARPHTA
jgi:hypothetical protein